MQRTFLHAEIAVSDSEDGTSVQGSGSSQEGVAVFGRSDYDCNGDGVKDCGDWNRGASRCGNPEKCGFQWKLGDLSHGHSCRCHGFEVRRAKQDEHLADYDCDGDGARDCGKWSYRHGSCENTEYCGHHFKFGDWNLGQSCRCNGAIVKLPESPPRRVDADYDCNSDGVKDCGKFDYMLGRCENLMYCGRFLRLGDLTLDQSCRCRRCNDPSLQDTAFGDGALQKPDGQLFDAMAWGTFRNWADHLDTCAPWVMPKDDRALQNLLTYARGKGYKVRISGAGHSAGGLVTDGENSNVLVLSLAEYTAPGEWEFGWRDMPDGSRRATVNAGWTQAHLYAMIRPEGFFLPAQTAGYFFALGGIVANSVHGGAYGAGFIHSYATRMRVMSFDGSIRVIDEEDEVRFWRNSFGLHGIILGIEFQLEHRDRLQMYTVEKKVPTWNAEEFWRFIKEDAEADVSPDVVEEGGKSGSRAAWNGEFFIDYINNPEQPTMAVYAQKANSSVDLDFAGELGVPANVEGNYAELLGKSVTDDWHGKMTWGEAARRDGAPPIEIMGAEVNDMLAALKFLPLAKTMSRAAITNIPRLARTLSQKVNDGFFLTESPDALAAAYFVEPAKAFEAMDFLRTVQVESLGDKEFMWNLPGEFRFINVQDSAVLQPIRAGLWFNAQMISFADLAKNDQAWRLDFKRVEDFWVQKLGAKPHMGKLWGFETGSDGVVSTFSKAFSCSVYSDEQKAAFAGYRSSQDPEGLFATGLGMDLLAPCK